MPVTVKVGQRLSESTAGETSLTARGATLGELIDDIEGRHPGFRREILATGRVLDWIHVSDDAGTTFRRADEPVADGAVLSISMDLSGG